MTININNLGVNNNTLSSSSNRASESNRSQTGESETRSTSSTTDNVELSQQALSLTSLETRISEAPDVDTARVDSIRQSIEDGSYAINADDIADRLLNSDALY